DRAGWREHGRLRVAVTNLATELEGLVPEIANRRIERQRHERWIEPVRVAAMLLDHLEHRLAILRVARERSHGAGDARRLEIRFAVHERRDRRGILAAR